MLLILAIWIAGILLPIGIIYTIIRNLRGIFTLGNKIAYLIDIIGNVICAELFNDVLIKSKKGHLFGNYNETISEALGINYFNNNLTITGLQLFSLIELHDYKHFHKVLGKIYYKEPKKEKRKRIFRLGVFYFVLIFIILLLFLI